MTEATLWLPDDVSSPWFWADDTGAFGIAETNADKAAIGENFGRSVSVIIAGQSVRAFPVSLPEMRASERLAAASYAVEDKLGASLSEQHVVLGGESNRVLVIGKSRITEILTALDTVGIQPSSMFVDFDALPLSMGTVRLGERVILCGPDGHAIDVAWHDGNRVRDLKPKDLQNMTVPSGAINLLSGAFAPRRQMSFDVKALSRTAALLVGAVLCWGLLNVVNTRAVAQQADHIRQQISQVYTAHTGFRTC